MVVRAVLLVALLATQAAADSVKAPACGPPKPTKTTPTSIRQVDWCNFDFGHWKGGLREGHNEVHLYADLGEPHDTIATSLRGIVYGDLDGDKRPEAALVIESSTWIGRTGDHSGGTSIYIYSLVKGTPTKLGSIPAGTPVDAVSLGKGIVTVRSGPTGQKATMRFRRVKGAFVEVPAKK